MPIAEKSAEKKKRFMAKAASPISSRRSQPRPQCLHRSRDFLRDVRSEMRKVVTRRGKKCSPPPPCHRRRLRLRGLLLDRRCVLGNAVKYIYTGWALCSNRRSQGLNGNGGRNAERNTNPGRRRRTGTAAARSPANERFRWYIIHAYSGFERKVRESIETRVQAFGLQNRIGRVMIPPKPSPKSPTARSAPWNASSSRLRPRRDGSRQRPLARHQKYARVTGFLGTGDKPVALTDDEVGSILFRSDSSKEKRASRSSSRRPSRFASPRDRSPTSTASSTSQRGSRNAEGHGDDLRPSTPVELDFGKVEKIA